MTEQIDEELQAMTRQMSDRIGVTASAAPDLTQAGPAPATKAVGQVPVITLVAGLAVIVGSIVLLRGAPSIGQPIGSDRVVALASPTSGPSDASPWPVPSSPSSSSAQSSSPITSAEPTGSEPATCIASALRTVGGRDGETGVVAISVGLTNTAPEACVLPGLPATVELLGQDEKALSLLMEPPLGSAANEVVLQPSVRNAAWLRLYWANWCGLNPGPITLRATFDGMAGAVSASIVGPLVPRCDNRKSGSTIQVDGVSAG